jgi:predicted RNase H-like nuclease (RuvC/YqgF family)
MIRLKSLLKEEEVVKNKETGNVLDGQHRLLVAENLGMKDVPAIYMNNPTKTELKEKIKELEEKQKKDEKTVKSQFEHMLRLQERCKDLKTQVTTGVVKSKPIPGIEDKDKTIDDLRDKLLQAEKNREII